MLEQLFTCLIQWLYNNLFSNITNWLIDKFRYRKAPQQSHTARKENLSAIVWELRWNRVASNKIRDIRDAYSKIGGLSTTAFERYMPELVDIDSNCTQKLHDHYYRIGVAREGIRAIGPYRLDLDPQLREHLEKLTTEARVGVSNSATEALKSLNLPLEK